MAESFAWRNKANSMKIWGLTDRGTVREQNQDTFHLWKEDNTAALLVCDGMGGARAGNVASAWRHRRSRKPSSTAMPSQISG